MNGEAQADRWDTLSGWLETWRTASADERVRLRDQFARDHPELLAEATALASASEEVSGFLETPALVLAARRFSQLDPPFAAGSMIGPYRVEGFLARGGMDQRIDIVAHGREDAHFLSHAC